MGKAIDIKYNLREYYRIAKNYKLLFFLCVIGMMIAEAINIVDKFLFKVLIDQGTLFANNEIVREVLVDVLILIGLIFVTLFVVRAITKTLTFFAINHFSSRTIADLKKNYFTHILFLSHTFHTNHKTGSLISRLTRAGAATERLTDVIIFNITPLAFQFVAVIASLAFFSWKPALAAFVTALFFIGYSLYIQIKQQPANVEANDAEDEEKATIADMYLNIDSVKYFGKENTALKKYQKKNDKARTTLLRNWNFFSWLEGGQSLILSAGLFFMLYFPLVDFLNGEMSLGTIVFIFTIYGNLVGPLFGFVHGMRQFYRSMADYESLFRYGKIRNNIKDKKSAKKARITTGKVEFKDVIFNFGKRNIFPKLNLTMKPNTKVALVGHSGCGKTTLVKLLFRFYDVNKGCILIDGEDIRNFKQESLRSEISIVPQEGVLFDDTLYNNVKFSKPTASRKEVMKAMKFAQLDQVLTKLPRKENTVVGERGVKLSGGEKQRVSIARAILADKKILLLDEATSSLDSKTEHEIQRDLKELMKGRTSIIIAHRLSTVMHADVIVVMDNGKIVEMGKHKELLKKNGMYKSLWDLQKSGFLL